MMSNEYILKIDGNIGGNIGTNTSITISKTVEVRKNLKRSRCEAETVSKVAVETVSEVESKLAVETVSEVESKLEVDTVSEVESKLAVDTVSEVESKLAVETVSEVAAVVDTVSEAEVAVETVLGTEVDDELNNRCYTGFMPHFDPSLLDKHDNTKHSLDYDDHQEGVKVFCQRCHGYCFKSNFWFQSDF